MGRDTGPAKPGKGHASKREASLADQAGAISVQAKSHPADTAAGEEDTGEEPLAEELGDLSSSEPLELDDDLPDTDVDHGHTSGAQALVPTSRSLAVRDPLQAYINEARRYPLLTREQEHELAVRYREEGDLEAARRLVTANLRLVVKIAHEYRRAYRNVLDLVQEGNIGLMHAVKKFDPYRGVKLSSYAAWWIRAYILKFVLNNWRLVKIGTTQTQRKLFFNLRKEIARLEQLGITNPGPKLIAEGLDVPEHEVRSMQTRLAGGDVSLDAPVKDESAASRIDFVSATEYGPDEAIADREFSTRVRAETEAFAATLTGRDREIFDLRTLAEEPLTLQQIGDRYGITRERARQLERRLMNRLRDHLKSRLGEAIKIHFGSREG